MNIVPKTSAFTCPCCKGFIGEAAPIEYAMAQMTTAMGQKILTKLSQPVGRGVSRDVLIEYLFAGEADGGPLNPVNSINVSVMKLRRQLASFGWTIINEKRSYRLVPMEAGAC